MIRDPRGRRKIIFVGAAGTDNAVPADTAWHLSALLETSPELWMNLQMHWDLWHAAQTLRTA